MADHDQVMVSSEAALRFLRHEDTIDDRKALKEAIAAAEDNRPTRATVGRSIRFHADCFFTELVIERRRFNEAWNHLWEARWFWSGGLLGMEPIWMARARREREGEIGR